MEMKALITGLIISLIFIGLVFLTGQTFGQKCATEYKKSSPEWSNCVENLSKGITHELN